MIYGYIRVSTDDQDTQNQKFEIETLRDLDLKYKYKIFSIQDFLKNKNEIKNIYEFIESNRYYFLFLNVKNFEYDIRGNL